ncbi:MAG: diacylglycerol kinase [Haliea sp.]|nr:MAG: diacylglycerol kinase [Haliea sp.]
MSPQNAGPPEPPQPNLAAPELLVIINPGSGAQEATETRDTLARVFKDAGRRHRFVQVESPGALEAAAEKAAAEAAQSAGVLVAVGGDGTINTLAAAAMKYGCALGVIPRGTFNYFARGHGIAQEVEAAALALLRGQAGPVQTGEVNGHLFLVNASLGLYPQLLQDRETFKNQFGRHRWVAALAGLVTLFEWRRQLNLEFEQQGQRLKRLTPTLFVGNSRLQLERIGIAPDIAATVGGGRLAAIVPRAIGSWALLGLLLRGAFGRLGEADRIDSFDFASLTVHVPRMRRLKLAVDGEVHVETPPLHFAVSPRPLMLVLPREEDRVPVE